MKRIAVIAGGWSGERSISLVSGEGIFKALQAAGEKVIGIDLVPDAAMKARPAATPAWARRIKLSAFLPALRAAKVDACLLALHGPGGEDGQIQGLLELGGIRYTGSKVRASALAMHKATAKRVMRDAGVTTADWVVATKDISGMSKGGHAGPPLPKFKLPCVVKPAEQGSALGVTIVRKASQMRAAIAKAMRYDREVLIEKYIQGRELTVAVLGDRALPVVEIIPEKNDFYDFASKYAKGGSRHLCPAPLGAKLSREAAALGLKAHRVLGCSGYSRTDIMLDKKGKLWVLEVNTLPGMTPTSLLPDAAKAAGISYLQLLRAMLRLS